jgi:hypothetical protein
MFTFIFSMITFYITFAKYYLEYERFAEKINY